MAVIEDRTLGTDGILFSVNLMYINGNDDDDEKYDHDSGDNDDVVVDDDDDTDYDHHCRNDE